MIAVPSCYDVLYRIRYKENNSIQRGNLLYFKTIKERFPKGTIFDILVYKVNAMYGWSPLNNVEIIDDTVTLNLWTTNVRTVNLLLPHKKKYQFVTLPNGFFGSDVLSPQSYLLGLLASHIVRESTIIIPYKHIQNRIIDIKRYIQEKNNNAKWELNGRNFIYSYYINNIKEIIEDYLQEYSYNTIDVYKTHQMIRSLYLTPLIFSIGNDKSDTNMSVPYDNYWVFQLMYGRNNNVYSRFSNGEEVSINNIEPIAMQNWTKVQKAILSVKSDRCAPVLISRNFVMRFKS